MNPTGELVVWTAAVTVSVAAAWFDAREFRIPRAIPGVGLVLGLFIHSAATGVWGLLDSGMGALVCGGSGFILWRTKRHATRLLGAGDVRLLGALGGILGLRGSLTVTLWGLVLLALWMTVSSAWAGIAPWRRTRGFALAPPVALSVVLHALMRVT